MERHFSRQSVAGKIGGGVNHLRPLLDKEGENAAPTFSLT